MKFQTPYVWPKDREFKRLEIEWRMVGRVFADGKFVESVEIEKDADNGFYVKVWSDFNEKSRSAEGMMREVHGKRFKSLANAMAFVDPTIEKGE